MTFRGGFVTLDTMSRGGVVALVSGGLDSWCLVQTLRKTRAAIHPVYVRCGLAWEPAELFWLREWLAKLPRRGLRALKVLHVPVHGLYGRHWSVTGRDVPASDSRDAAVYLPGRNVLLLAHAAVYGLQQGLSTIALGTLAGNPFQDATPGFLHSFAGCLKQALSRPVRIATPLRRLTKARLIAAWPTGPLHLTFSCLAPAGNRHCGRCNKCAERRRAFEGAGVPDPTLYAA